MNENNKYYQMKVQTIIIQSQVRSLLQLSNVSAKILFNKSVGEKKLLSLINAAVSHEMRNPINSINSQIIQQQFLNQLLQDLINDHALCSLRDFKIKVNIILQQKIFSISIMKSGETNLNFLVSDILDYSLLK